MQGFRIIIKPEILHFPEDDVNYTTPVPTKQFVLVAEKIQEYYKAYISKKYKPKVTPVKKNKTLIIEWQMKQKRTAKEKTDLDVIHSLIESPDEEGNYPVTIGKKHIFWTSTVLK
jgi:hypothetical protein